MRLLAELRDRQFGRDESTVSWPSSFRERSAARMILFNRASEIALLHVSNYGYHKLPGGGVEEGEDWRDAALREAREETGCVITLRDTEVGSIIEWRSAFALKQTSICFIGDVVEDLGKTDLTQEESLDGLQLRWKSFGDAITALEGDIPTDYMGHFIQKRDLTFLAAAKAIVL